jgi:hypothetical protein
MDRLEDLAARIHELFDPTNAPFPVEADRIICEWRQSDFVIPDSIFLATHTDDQQILFIAMNTLVHVIRSRFESFSDDLISSLFPFFLEFVRHQSARSEESFFRFALVSLADLCLQLTRTTFSIPLFWDSLPEEHRVATLLFYLQDSGETFCRFHRQESEIIQQDFTFGLAQLQVLPFSLQWLQLFQALSAICADHCEFLPVLPLFRQCIESSQMILIVIDILSNLVVLNLEVVLRNFCVTFGAELSAFLRQKWAETGDVDNLQMLSHLWTGILLAEDENETLFDPSFAGELMAALTEFLQAGDLLASNIHEFDDPHDWHSLFQAAFGMAESFSKFGDHSFVAQIFDLLIAVLNAGAEIHPDKCQAKAAFPNESPFLTEWFAAKLETPSPGLLIVPRDLIGRFPPELLNSYCAHLPAFAACLPVGVVLDFVYAAAECRVEEHLALLVSLVVSAFPSHPALACRPLRRLCQRHHAPIMAGGSDLLDFLMAALPQLDEECFVMAAIASAWLLLDCPEPVPRLAFFGTLPTGAFHRLTPEMGMRVFWHTIVILSQSPNPAYREFCVSFADAFLALCEPFWTVLELQAALAEVVRCCLVRGLLSDEMRTFLARWIDSMILEHQIPAYLDCLPYLWPFGPMEHVAAYFENFGSFAHEDVLVRGQGLFPCLATTLQIYGHRTWELIPIGVIGIALGKYRCDKAVVDLVTRFRQSFPPEAVLEVIRILHMKSGSEEVPFVLTNLLQSMSPETT